MKTVFINAKDGAEIEIGNDSNSEEVYIIATDLSETVAVEFLPEDARQVAKALNQAVDEKEEKK